MGVSAYSSRSNKRVFTNHPFRRGMIYENLTMNENMAKTIINFDIASTGDYGYPRESFINAKMHRFSPLAMSRHILKQQTNLNKTFLIGFSHVVSEEDYINGTNISEAESDYTFGIQIEQIGGDITEFEHKDKVFDAEVKHIIDADTIIFEHAELPDKEWRVRVLGVDAPEMDTTEGQLATAFVEWLEDEGYLNEIYLQHDPVTSYKEYNVDEPRLLAYVWFKHNGNYYNLAHILIQAGLGKLFLDANYEYFSLISNDIEISMPEDATATDFGEFMTAYLESEDTAYYLNTTPAPLDIEDHNTIRKPMDIQGTTLDDRVFDTESYYEEEKEPTEEFDFGDAHIEILHHRHTEVKDNITYFMDEYPYTDMTWRNAIMFLGRIVNDSQIVYKGPIILQHSTHEDEPKHYVLIIKPKQVNLGALTLHEEEMSLITYNLLHPSPFIFKDFILDPYTAFIRPTVLGVFLYDRYFDENSSIEDLQKVQVVSDVNQQDNVFIKPYIALPEITKQDYKGTYMRIRTFREEDSPWVKLVDGDNVLADFPDLEDYETWEQYFHREWDFSQTAGRPIFADLKMKFEKELTKQPIGDYFIEDPDASVSYLNATLDIFESATTHNTHNAILIPLNKNEASHNFTEARFVIKHTYGRNEMLHWRGMQYNEFGETLKQNTTNVTGRIASDAIEVLDTQASTLNFCLWIRQFASGNSNYFDAYQVDIEAFFYDDSGEFIDRVLEEDIGVANTITKNTYRYFEFAQEFEPPVNGDFMAVQLTFYNKVTNEIERPTGFIFGGYLDNTEYLCAINPKHMMIHTLDSPTQLLEDSNNIYIETRENLTPSDGFKSFRIRGVYGTWSPIQHETWEVNLGVLACYNHSLTEDGLMQELEDDNMEHLAAGTGEYLLGDGEILYDSEDPQHTTMKTWYYADIGDFSNFADVGFTKDETNKTDMQGSFEYKYVICVKTTLDEDGYVKAEILGYQYTPTTFAGYFQQNNPDLDDPLNVLRNSHLMLTEPIIGNINNASYRVVNYEKTESGGTHKIFINGFRFTIDLKPIDLENPTPEETVVQHRIFMFEAEKKFEEIEHTGTSYPLQLRERKLVDPHEMIKSHNLWNATNLARFDRFVLLYGDHIGTNTLQFLEYDEPSFAPYPYGSIEFDAKIVHVHPHKGNLYVFCEDGLWILHDGFGYEDMRKTFAYAGVKLNPAEKSSVISSGNEVFYMNNGRGYVVRTNVNVENQEDVYVMPVTQPVNGIIQDPHKFFQKRLTEGYGLVSNELEHVHVNFFTRASSTELMLFASYDFENIGKNIMLTFIFDKDHRRWRMYETIAGSFPYDSVSSASPTGFDLLLKNGAEGNLVSYGAWQYYLPSELENISRGDYEEETGVMPIQCLLDTGALGISETHQKKIRKFSFDFMDLEQPDFYFYTVPYVDAKDHQNKVDLTVALEENGVVTEVIENIDEVQVSIFPATTGQSFPQNYYKTVLKPHQMKAKFTLDNHVSMLGKMPGVRLFLPTFNKYKIGPYAIVYRQMKAR